MIFAVTKNNDNEYERDAYLNIERYVEIIDVIQKNHPLKQSINEIIDDSAYSVLKFVDKDATIVPHSVYVKLFEHLQKNFGIMLFYSGNKFYIKNVEYKSIAYNANISDDVILLKINNIDINKITEEDLENISNAKNLILNTIYKGVLNEYNMPVEQNISIFKKISDTNINFLYIELCNLNRYYYKAAQSAIENQENIDGIIIDLRNNNSRNTENAISFMKKFLNDRDIIYMIGKSKNDTIAYTASFNSSIYSKIPVIVLTNNKTKFAGEIITAALKHNARSITIGSKTAGACYTQKYIKLNKSDESIRIKSAFCITPSKQHIDGVGIKPDIDLSDYNINEKDALQYAVNFLKHLMIFKKTYNYESSN